MKYFLLGLAALITGACILAFWYVCSISLFFSCW